MSDSVRSFLSVAGGLVLSFLAFGVLWIGTPWKYQALMGVPFFLLTLATAWKDEDGGKRQLALVLAGAAPLGLLIMKFRDPSGSHVKPVLIVCAWAAGAALGWLAARRR
jgi:hypothetical protein